MAGENVEEKDKAKKQLKNNSLIKPASTAPGACKCCGDKVLDHIGKKEGYYFWECATCKFIFTDIPYKEMVKTYASGYHNIEDGAPQKGWAYSLEFLTPALALLPDRKLKILDFGCGESYIPDRLRDNGHKVTAVDIVPPLKEHPDRITGDILKLDIAPDTYDLIYSYQVFEHISEPVPVIRKLLNLLNDKGMLLIHTDMETPEKYAERFIDWWYVLPPDHCSYFSHKTFEKVFEDQKCKMIYKNPKSVMAVKCPE